MSVNYEEMANDEATAILCGAVRRVWTGDLSDAPLWARFNYLDRVWITVWKLMHSTEHVDMSPELRKDMNFVAMLRRGFQLEASGVYVGIVDPPDNAGNRTEVVATRDEVNKVAANLKAICEKVDECPS